MSGMVKAMHSLRDVRELARYGKFEELQKHYPNRILLADDEYRLIVVSGDEGTHSTCLPLMTRYVANYIFVPKDGYWKIAKCRAGRDDLVKSTIEQALGYTCTVSIAGERIDFKEADATMLKLRGLL